MSEYKSIECECGNFYSTKSYVSNCPYCGKQNWTLEGGLFVILIIIAVVILIGLMFGAIGFVFYLINNKSNKWYFVGNIAFGIFCIFLFNSIYSYNIYPIMSWITYLSNGSAIVISSIFLFKSINKTNQETNPQKESAQVTKKISEEDQAKLKKMISNADFLKAGQKRYATKMLNHWESVEDVEAYLQKNELVNKN